MRGEGIWRTAGVVVATAVVTAMWGYLFTTWPPEPPASSVQLQPPAPSSAPAVEEVETVAVVLGDGFSTPEAGIRAPAWPDLLADELGWDVTTDAAAGSGYLAAGEGAPFPDRVADVLDRSPDVVVLAGGISDLGRPGDEIAQAAEEVVLELDEALPDAHVVVLSPFSNGPPGELTTELTVLLEQVASRTGAEYVDVSQLLPRDRGMLADDGLHPSAQGHEQIAGHLAEELGRLPVG